LRQRCNNLGIDRRRPFRTRYGGGRISKMRRIWREYVSPNIYNTYQGLKRALPVVGNVMMAPITTMYNVAEMGSYAAAGPAGPIMLEITTAPIRWVAHNPLEAVQIGAATSWTAGFVVGLTSEDYLSLDSYVQAGLAIWDANGNLVVAGPELLGMFLHLYEGKILSFIGSGISGGMAGVKAIINMAKALYYTGKIMGVNAKNVKNAIQGAYSFINDYVKYPVWNGSKWIYRNIMMS
jgi:hypothetical protein